MTSLRSLRVPTLALALLTGCAAEPAPESAGPVPVALRLTVSGESDAVLDADGKGRLELNRAGAREPVAFAFTNGELAVHDLDPGRYEIAWLGPLQCRDLAFEVGAEPRYLGSVGAELVRARHQVALMSRASAAPGDTAALAERAGTPAAAVDARLLEVGEITPCSLGPGGPLTTWRDLTLGEKIILGTGVGALCALSVAAGGFCSF